MSAKIIIFENTEDHEFWINTNFNCTVMYFSRGFNDDSDETIDMLDMGEWQFNGIEKEAIDPNFDKTWAIGQDFSDNPERTTKIKEKKYLENEIDKVEKLLKHYKSEYKKI